MDSPTERMPIACVHCAKAKAKCDKKVPCSRCVTKQIVCQSRATRRSSHNPNRRNGMPRPHSERALTTSTGSFHVSQLSQFAAPTPSVHEVPMLSPTNKTFAQSPSYYGMPGPGQMQPPPQMPQYAMAPHPGHRNSVPDIRHSHVQIAPAMPYQDPEQQMRSGFTQTPPDMPVPVTPMMPNMSHIDPFGSMAGTPYDHDPDNQFLAMSSAHSTYMDFDTSNMLDFTSPPSMFQDSNDQYMFNPKAMHTPNHLQISTHEGSTTTKSGLENRSPHFHVPNKVSAPLSPSNSSASGLLEPDAVVASHHAWPFFQCNRVERNSYFPPKTAHIYLEGLAQTLRNQATWQAWTAQIDERSLDLDTERRILTEPIIGWSREKLLAITQSFLHKALEIHKNDNDHNSTPASPESTRDSFLMLPPPDVMTYFLRSYAVRYEPYYSSVAGGRLDPNALMHSANSKAASLLILLMVASGASATPTADARYIASGLTEACRISLFDTIEKDVLQSRDTLILRAALLFISLAAWSGDKWHMDMAMGQRGTYLAMLDHSGLLESCDSQFEIEQCRRDPVRAWEDWKELESRHRLTHSWIMVDQEMSLFSDANPLLSAVDLHAPMPDNDDLWHASTSSEWLELFEKIHGASFKSPASLRDFFTRFVDGDFAGKTLSPTQLRLLLHPLQAQVCHLRQFIACLPDGSNQGRTSRAVSKAATKARLEEIQALLEQWYAIAKQSFSGQKGNCWTTCANLIMYHLISLNAITSFKCIEQFARREVVLGPFKHAAWLQMRCIDQPEEVYFHSGQILRLIRSMPRQVRPPWWAGAIYRVALTGWATSMAAKDTRFNSSNHGSPMEIDRPFAIDDLTPENEAISRYMKYQEGTPMLIRPDGTMAPLDVPSNMLQHCVAVLEDDSSMRLADGIKRKLRVFMNSWKDT